MAADSRCRFQLSKRLVAVSLVLIWVGFVSHEAWSQTQYDTSPPAQTGEQTYGSYFSTDIDTVAIFNGNLNLRIGLFSRPGRELSTSVGFSYNNQKWENTTPGAWPAYGIGRYSGGWRLGAPFGSDLSVFGQFLDCNPYTGYWSDV